MKVEADCYTLKRRNEDILNHSLSVSSGSCESISFLGPEIKIIVFCDIDGGKGTVWVRGDNIQKKIEAIKYEDEDDTTGELINVCDPIEIVGSQELSVLTKKRRKKEVYVYLDRDEDKDLETFPDIWIPLVRA